MPDRDDMLGAPPLQGAGGFGYHQWTVRMLIRGISAAAVIMGALVLVGGRVRLSGPSYHVLGDIPGSPWVWAIPIALCGLATLLASTRIGFSVYPGHWARVVGALGLMGQSVWYLCWGFAMALAAATNHEATFTGPVANGLLAIICAVLAVSIRRWG